MQQWQKQDFQFDLAGVLTQTMAMRFLRFMPFLFVLPVASVPLVDAQVPENMAPSAAEEARSQRLKLDALFYDLRHCETAEEASKAEAEIFIRLAVAKSPTVNLLLESAAAALGNEDDVTAKAIMADVVALEPTFAEGLTRAASLAYQDGEFEQAKDLLNRALKQEPRHFGAWAGLGLVLEDLGDLKGAEHAYREALYFHPFLDAAKRGLIRVEAKTIGLSL